ncbi:hypothetical protein AK812_SmicGene28180 [Symbiodinium microadriaticum]|uniref:Uncharacterized protein n=1 Tax=Symbiodinium microadriaticum TaxID=2951 RepID=A0A1Q9D4Z5_SYMMI|nr:hypothetical protein AK812_SmicGene28180 [Symbiodinium microadriaticum]
MAGAGSLDRGANFLGGTRVGWASVCFEQIDEKDTGDFKYAVGSEGLVLGRVEVGSGRGDYEQEHDFPPTVLVATAAVETVLAISRVRLLHLLLLSSHHDHSYQSSVMTITPTAPHSCLLSVLYNYWSSTMGQQRRHMERAPLVLSSKYQAVVTAISPMTTMAYGHVAACKHAFAH